MDSKKVLLIEDNADAQGLIREALRIEGYVVDAASNGHEAFDYLAKNAKPDLILLDLTLPGMSGAEFMGMLRSNPELKSLKVVILSGWDNLGARANEIGANGFIQKPFDLGTFYKEIERYF